MPLVGLCHSVQGTSAQLAGFLGLPYEDISYVVAGVNHMAFFLKFDYRGQDASPLLFNLLDDPSFPSEKVRFEMMRRTGYFVTESSEHQSEYLPYFIHHAVKPGTGRSLASLAQVVAEVKAPSVVRRAKGEENLLEVVVTNAHDWSGPQEYVLTSTGATPVLCRSVKLYPRQELSLARGTAVRSDLDLAGNPAIRGTLQREETDLALRGRVHDSNPVNDAAETAPWVGSCVELFFDRVGGGHIIQLFLVPRPGQKAPLLKDRLLAAVAGAKANQKIGPNGWNFEVTLPLASIGLAPGADFLFDVNARLSALGDAHSGGRTSLTAVSRATRPADITHWSEVRFRVKKASWTNSSAIPISPWPTESKTCSAA